ncbi:unnamed protein product [Acanthoscelides obtectus]|uniref:Uncharacterized protein n=1 Tax=Acanthoscelides obtectus TaxID=200917 RepID=A0A9P0L6R0_ACAOB|nr:unnamed protein product [Acanthoscelides obtectus]CAK1632779.1 hypothetical protein AOBTE_LOCUS7727 [Acanthoscelides obtectus]
MYFIQFGTVAVYTRAGREAYKIKRKGAYLHRLLRMPNKTLERLLQKNMYKKMMGDQQLRTTKLMMFPKYLLRQEA